MSRRYKFHNSLGIYFISFAVQGWVDVFTRKEYKDILVENLAFCQKAKGLELFAWCIMPNHLHLIARAVEEHNISDILRDFKKHTSKVLIKAIAANPVESRKKWLLQQFKTADGYRFWRADNKPIELYSDAVFYQKLDYLHKNPVTAGIVFKAENYIYSSAVAYVANSNKHENPDTPAAMLELSMLD